MPKPIEIDGSTWRCFQDGNGRAWKCDGVPMEVRRNAGRTTYAAYWGIALIGDRYRSIEGAMRAAVLANKSLDAA